MNLFATSECPRQSARDLDDKRVVKQVTETAQLLSTATRRLMGDALTVGLDRQLYRQSHSAHPVALWVRSSWEAFSWTLEHGLALHSEYCERFPTRVGIHEGSPPIYAVLGASKSLVQPRMFRPLTQPPAFLCNAAANQSVGLDFRDYPKTTDAYRMYLAARYRLARAAGQDVRWTGREAPEWVGPAMRLADEYERALGQPRGAIG